MKDNTTSRSDWLLDESRRFVHPTLAVKLGLNTGHVLCQLWWLAEISGRGELKTDGAWIKCTVKGLHAELPWLSIPQLDRIISNLLKLGLIKKSSNGKGRPNSYQVREREVRKLAACTNGIYHHDRYSDGHDDGLQSITAIDTLPSTPLYYIQNTQNKKKQKRCRGRNSLRSFPWRGQACTV